MLSAVEPGVDGKRSLAEGGSVVEGAVLDVVVLGTDDSIALGGGPEARPPDAQPPAISAPAVRSKKRRLTQVGSASLTRVRSGQRRREQFDNLFV